MAIKKTVTAVEIDSAHDGFIEVTRHSENNGTWLEIRGDTDFPFILESAQDIDKLCKCLQECKILLK